MIVATVDLENPDHTVLVIVIEKENLDRMRQADPITLESKAQGGRVMPTIRNPGNLSLLIAYEEDEVELYKIARSGDLGRLLHYLQRRRAWDPAVDGNSNILNLSKP